MHTEAFFLAAIYHVDFYVHKPGVVDATDCRHAFVSHMLFAFVVVHAGLLGHPCIHGARIWHVPVLVQMDRENERETHAHVADRPFG